MALASEADTGSASRQKSGAGFASIGTGTALVAGHRLIRQLEEGFRERKLEHHLALLVRHLDDGTEQRPDCAFAPQQFQDHRPRDFPGAIGVAQFFAFGILDQLIADPGVEEISGHGNPLGLARQNWKTCGSHNCFIRALYPTSVAPPLRIKRVRTCAAPRKCRPVACLRPSGSTIGPQPFRDAKAACLVSRCENFTSELPAARYLMDKGGHPINLVTTDQRRRAKMAWKAPKIVEVPVGMEINMYACAARK